MGGRRVCAVRCVRATARNAACCGARGPRQGRPPPPTRRDVRRCDRAGDGAGAKVRPDRLDAGVQPERAVRGEQRHRALRPRWCGQGSRPRLAALAPSLCAGVCPWGCPCMSHFEVGCPVSLHQLAQLTYVLRISLALTALAPAQAWPPGPGRSRGSDAARMPKEVRAQKTMIEAPEATGEQGGRADQQGGRRHPRGGWAPQGHPLYRGGEGAGGGGGGGPWKEGAVGRKGTLKKGAPAPRPRSGAAPRAPRPWARRR
jgi:hypothetical protein